MFIEKIFKFLNGALYFRQKLKNVKLKREMISLIWRWWIIPWKGK